MKLSVKQIILIASIVLIGGLAFWFFKFKNKPVISSAKVNITTLEEKLTVAGEIDALEKATLRFPGVGKLYWLGVRDQEFVKKGTALARLDPADFDKAVSDAWYTYLAADANAKKVEDDVKDKASTENFAEKNTRVAAQVARDKAYDAWLKAKRDLASSTLYAPFEGVITNLTVPNPGTWITSPTQAEFTLVNPNSLYFSASIDQAEINLITTGMAGDLVLDAFPEQKLTGSVAKVAFSPKPEETGTVYAVWFSINSNPGLTFRLGMTGDLTFVTKRKENILTIPIKYVKTDAGKKFVYKDSKKTIKAYIETGMEADGLLEVVSGLTNTDVVYD